MSLSPLKPDRASTPEIPHDFLAQIKDDIANRRIEAGLRCLTAHQEILKSIQLRQNNSVILVGYSAKWVDVGFPGRPLLKQLLSHSSTPPSERLTLLEYAHLPIVARLLAM